MLRMFQIAAILLVLLAAAPVFADTYYGDIDGGTGGNGTHADLEDAVIALKIVSNQDVSGQIVNAVDEIDVNGDSRIGLEEAAYALQVVSGARGDTAYQPPKPSSLFLFGSGMFSLLWLRLRRKFRQVRQSFAKRFALSRS